MHLKIDAVLDPLLDHVGSKKSFSFKAEEDDAKSSGSSDEIIDEDLDMDPVDPSPTVKLAAENASPQIGQDQPQPSEQ